MALVINCDCGTVVRGEDEDEVAKNGIEHAKAAHAMTVTREQVLALAQPEE